VIVAASVCPSANSTWTEPPLAAIEVTWLFVRMYPSDRITSPDPVPLPRPPLPLAAIVTTEGMTSSATGVTAHALTVDEPAVLELGEAPEADGVVAATMTPPTTPPTTSATPAAAHGSHRRVLPAASDCVMSAP
jgi:hypothetical protein